VVADDGIERAAPLAHALTEQHGVLAMRQAVRLLGRGVVRWRLQDGVWQRPHHRVVVTHNGPLTPQQHLWVALCAAPPGSVLSGATAAAQDGLRGFEDRTIHVTIRQGQRRPLVDGAAFRWSGQLSALDVHPLRSPPRTRTARSLLDMAADATSDRAARSVLLAGVQQRLVQPPALTEALLTRGPCLRHALILETIEDSTGGVHSVPEREFRQLVRARGLPEPARQRLLQRPDGRYYLDSDWSDYGVSVEVQGSHHHRIESWDDDLERHNAISAGGRRVMHFSSYAIRHRSGRVASLLAEALQTGGWRG